MNSGTTLHQFDGTAQELHALPMPTEGEQAALWVMRPTAPALVMGSSQKPDMFDHERLAFDGVALASRRSGGGAVFIEPASTVWIDLVAPRSSEFWSNELTENFMLVGRVWQSALGALGLQTHVCSSAPAQSPVARLACWAGIGWGEVTHGQAKVVGLSQRRTRWGVRVQAMAVLDSSSVRVAEYFAAEHRSTLADAVAAVETGLSGSELETAVLSAFIQPTA